MDHERQGQSHRNHDAAHHAQMARARSPGRQEEPKQQVADSCADDLAFAIRCKRWRRRMESRRPGVPVALTACADAACESDQHATSHMSGRIPRCRLLVFHTTRTGGLSWATHAGLTPSLTPLSRLPASVSPAVRGGVSRSRHQIRESVAHVANRREWTSSHSDPPQRPSGSYLDSFRSEIRHHG